MSGRHRSWQSQVKSGFVLAVVVVTVIILIGVLLVGLAILIGQAQGAEWQKNKWIGLSMVAFVGVMLFVTINRWIGWFWGCMAFTSIKAFFVLLTGRYWTGTVPRLLALELLVLCIMTVIFGYKFIDRPPKTFVGKTMLVGTFISVCLTFLSNSVLPFIGAICFLLLAHLSVFTLERHQAHRSRLQM